jgi:Ni,Fe-hydrogenase III component G
MIGQFAAIQFLDGNTQSFQLKTESNSIHGINQQNLTYYYYLSNIGQKSITVRKEEADGTNEIIDVVSNSPFNGWIERQVTFNAMRRGYKVQKSGCLFN